MSDVVDAQFSEAAPLAVTPQAGTNNAIAEFSPAQSADKMVANLREWERFKATAIREKDWVKIPGVDGMYLPAEAIDRIAPAIGLSWEIISKNEHGDPGVRMQIIDALTYRKKTITKKRRDGSTYTTEADDHEAPVKTLAAIYTVTVRCRDNFGRKVEVEGSFSSLEMPKTDYHARQQALSRARRVGSLRLIGGIDHDVYEEEVARINEERRIEAVRASRVPSPGQLFARAKDLGLCTDGPSFRAWLADNVEGCGDARNPQWQPTTENREAIHATLEVIAP